MTAEAIGHFGPALAADLAGLPPAFIAVGALDLFAEEDDAYARRLARAGLPVEFHLYPGGIHGFDHAGGDLARQLECDSTRAITKFLG